MRYRCSCCSLHDVFRTFEVGTCCHEVREIGWIERGNDSHVDLKWISRLLIESRLTWPGWRLITAHPYQMYVTVFVPSKNLNTFLASAAQMKLVAHRTNWSVGYEWGKSIDSSVFLERNAVWLEWFRYSNCGNWNGLPDYPQNRTDQKNPSLRIFRAVSAGGDKIQRPNELTLCVIGISLGHMASIH